MDDWSFTEGLCQREAQPAQNYQFFCNLCQFTKIYVTDFDQSQFWWITDCGFKSVSHIFNQIFVHVDPHVD